MRVLDRLTCLVEGHPGWIETTLRPKAPAPGQVPDFGIQYSTRGAGPLPAEVEASIMDGRAWRCTRCRTGRVTDVDWRRAER